MIVGLGVDLTQAVRIEKLLRKYGDRFITKVFHESERNYCEGKPDAAVRYAARVAAKEAASKALGTGFARGVHFRSFEVVNQPGGQPELLLHGAAKELAEQLGVRKVFLTLSHEEGLALAQVVMEG